MKTYTQIKSVQDFNKKALLGALLAAGMVMGSASVSAATASGDMAVTATLTSSCSVSASTLDFGNITAMNTTAIVTADTGTTLQIACSNGTTPVIYSTTARTLSNGAASSITFLLGQTNNATDDLPTTNTGQPILSGWTADGAPHTVVIYGTIPVANFSTKPVGAYTASIAISVDYI